MLCQDLIGTIWYNGCKHIGLIIFCWQHLSLHFRSIFTFEACPGNVFDAIDRKCLYTLSWYSRRSSHFLRSNPTNRAYSWGFLSCWVAWSCTSSEPLSRSILKRMGTASRSTIAWVWWALPETMFRMAHLGQLCHSPPPVPSLFANHCPAYAAATAQQCPTYFTVAGWVSSEISIPITSAYQIMIPLHTNYHFNHYSHLRFHEIYSIKMY